MLKFLGNGSCFNTKAGNNACYYLNKDKKSILFIDCGESIFEKIMSNELLNDIENIDILITHLHSDHVGSLSSLLFFCKYRLGIECTVIYPDKDTIRNYLNLLGAIDGFKIINPSEYKKYVVTEIEQKHDENLKVAYGYLLNIEGNTIYYSGDTSSINLNVLEKFNKGQIDYFYQDVTKQKGSIHMYIDDLNQLILPEKKKNVFCMHFDSDITIEIAERFGFNIAKIEK